MSTLHPHWRSTDKEEQSVPVRVVASKESPEKNGTTVSRKPAAIAGIALVLVLGITFFQGVQSLTGQLAGDTITVRITESGLEPASIEVQQGSTVQWINEQNTPHILESTTLCNQAGECLYTPTIFQNEHVLFDITSDIAPGVYTYSSVTSTTIGGEITVIAAVQEATPPEQVSPGTPEVPLPPETPDPVPAEIPAEPEPVQVEPAIPAPIIDSKPAAPAQPTLSNTPAADETSVPMPAPTPVPAPVLPAASSEQLPSNPNTVSAQRMGITTAAVVNPSPTHTGAPPASTHKPISQPQTGASLWIVSILSIAGIFWVTRKTFKASL